MEYKKEEETNSGRAQDSTFQQSFIKQLRQLQMIGLNREMTVEEKEKLEGLKEFGLYFDFSSNANVLPLYAEDTSRSGSQQLEQQQVGSSGQQFGIVPQQVDFGPHLIDNDNDSYQLFNAERFDLNTDLNKIFDVESYFQNIEPKDPNQELIGVEQQTQHLLEEYLPQEEESEESMFEFADNHRLRYFQDIDIEEDINSDQERETLLRQSPILPPD
jgi:hypothetical protein